MDLNLLTKKANKHKKFLENQVIINPFAYQVNNVDYFLVIYQRGQNFKGYSVISESEYSKQDAIKAFEKLIVFTVFGNNFFDIEEAKMKLSPDSFKNIRNVIEAYLDKNNNLNSNTNLLRGKEYLLKQESILEEIQTRIKNYISHYDNKILVNHKIDEKEIYTLWEVLSHLNRLQYLQAKEMIEYFDAVRLMYKEMENLNLVDKLSNFDKTVLKEMQKDIKDVKRDIKSLDVEQQVSDLPVNEQIQHLVKEFEKAGKEKLPRYKRDLRYPKP
jgi:translation initiation factor 2 beta subunit (eIF-2beta)/eIF-5